MKEVPGYIKHIDRISKEEFSGLFSGMEQVKEWFSESELAAHPFPRNAGSLAARYLVKKRVRDYLGIESRMNEMEIINDEFGKPIVILGEGIKQQMKKRRIGEIVCSLSHSRNYAAAMTVIAMIADC